MGRTELTEQSGQDKIDMDWRTGLTGRDRPYVKQDMMGRKKWTGKDEHDMWKGLDRKQDRI